MVSLICVGMFTPIRRLAACYVKGPWFGVPRFQCASVVPLCAVSIGHAER